MGDLHRVPWDYKTPSHGSLSFLVVGQFDVLVKVTSAASISEDLRSKKDTSFPLSPRVAGFARPRCISARALRALLTELAKFPW